MKNFQRSLFVVIAVALCGLCIYQWQIQTEQRAQIQRLNDDVYQRLVAVQGYTNSIKTLDAQVAQMQSQIKDLEQTANSKGQMVVEQKRDIFELKAAERSYTNQIAEYKQAVSDLQSKLKEAYDGIKKQNAAVKELVQQRDALLKKVNDSIADRNNVVDKYNDLVQKVEKMQATQQKQ